MRWKSICAGLLTACMLAGQAFAASDSQTAADRLRTLGLFQGTEQGDELDRPLTRAEAAVMLVRLLGRTADLADAPASPFTDLSDWAAPYVDRLYADGLTQGAGAGVYCPDTPISYDQYALFLGRALGFDDNATATGSGVVPAGDYLARRGQPITRGEAAALSEQALCHVVADGRETLAEQLIARGVFTKSAWAASGSAQRAQSKPLAERLKGSAWSQHYAPGGYQIVRTADGRTQAASDRRFQTATLTYGADGIFGYDADALYYVDPETLTSTVLLTLPHYAASYGTAQRADVLGHQDGTFLIRIWTGQNEGRLYTWTLTGGVQLLRDKWTGGDTDVQTAESAGSRYFGGSFGIVQIDSTGHAAQLTQTPCRALAFFSGILYFIPQDDYMSDDSPRADWSNGGREVRVLSVGHETTVLRIPDGPIRLDTIVAADGDTVTARGTLHDGWDTQWTVTFQGTAEAASVLDVGDTRALPGKTGRQTPVSRSELLAWWGDTLGLPVQTA